MAPNCKTITFKRGDDVIGWSDYTGQVPLSGGSITLAQADIAYSGAHSFSDLNGPGLLLDFQDALGKSLGTLNGTPAFTNMQTVTLKVW